MNKRGGRKAQVTVFIIIAIIIVAGIIGFFLLRDRIFVQTFPSKFQPVETRFLDCLKDKAEQGKEILSDRGGYIYLPEFQPGSQYAPFSNQFDFNGIGIPYWYYVSSASSAKEQVPTRSEMQEQLKKYLEENFACDFSDLEAQGYLINYTDIKASVVINDLSVDVQADSELYVQREGESARQISHKTSIDTKLGKFYNEALEIYNNEKKEMFLEQYAIDALRLYAPVDGVEISCAPKVWMPSKVVGDIQDALEANIPALSTKPASLKPENKYFFIGTEIEDETNFIYSRNFPGRIEIWPADNGAMIAEPVGNQQGLGILGFCYVRYHFVYDLMFPVLIQVYDSNEIFQFPVAVAVQKNNPREALPGTTEESQNVDLCKYKNTEVSVYTYNNKLEPVEAGISFKCFDSSCDIGNTKIIEGNAVLSENFPQCVNGFIIARAEGYAEKKYQFSTNQPGVVDIVLDKLYNVSLDVEVGGKESESAVIYFTSEDYSATVVWPEQKTVKLTEGLYNVSVSAYRNSSLVFPATSQQKCIDVPKPGLLGIFGGTQEQCFDIGMPQQQLTNVLAGGGKTTDYFTEDRLEKGLKISGESLPSPTSLEQLEKNYEIFETKNLIITEK